MSCKNGEKRPLSSVPASDSQTETGPDAARPEPPEPVAGQGRRREPALDRPRLTALAGLNARPPLAGLLAFLAGTALPLAFAPLGLWYLAPLPLAGLYLLLLHAPPRQAVWRGYLFGLGELLVGLSWVQVSIHNFGMPILAFSAGLTLLFLSFFALYAGLAGYCAARVFGHLPVGTRLLLVYPGLWCLGEDLRAVVVTGYSWLLLGESQIDSPLAGLLPVVGGTGVALVVAVTAGAIVQLVRGGWRGRGLALALIALPWGLGAALTGHPWATPVGRPLSVVLIQANISPRDKWLPDARQRILDTYVRLSEPHLGVQLLVWPETAIPAFADDASDFLHALDLGAAEHGSAVLTGVPIKEGKHYYNSLLAFGTGRGRYDKRHLVPFGEFLPVPWLFGPIVQYLSIPMANFTEGEGRQAAIPVAGVHLGVTICFEDAFSALVRAALPEADVLLNVSDDAWFGDSLAPHQHLAIARLRTLELGRPLVRGTNNGISALIDHQGRVLARTPQFVATSLRGEVQPTQGLTPFARLGELPLALALVGALALVRLVYRPARHRVIRHSSSPTENNGATRE